MVSTKKKDVKVTKYIRKNKTKEKILQTPVIYKPFKNLSKVEPESILCSASWNPFIQMRRINLLVSSDRTRFRTKGNIKTRENNPNISENIYFENHRCQQITKNPLPKLTTTNLAAYALLQPTVRLKRLDLKAITKLNNELVRSSTRSHVVSKSVQNKKEIVRRPTILNHVADWPLRSSRRTTFQFVQNKILTCRKRGTHELRNHGTTQNQSDNKLNNLFPKPLKREPVDLIASRGLNNEPVRTLPKPIRVKHELILKRIQPKEFIQKENGNKENCFKQEPYTKLLQPVVKLQRLNFVKEKGKSNHLMESFFDTLTFKDMIKPNRVQLHTSSVKEDSRSSNLLQKQNKKFMRAPISTAFKNMQPKVKLKRLKLTNGKICSQYFAGQLKTKVNSLKSAPILRLKRLELKYFLQLKSGRFLLTDTCLKKKHKNSKKFKPIPVKLEEFNKFDCLINSQRRVNCNMIEELCDKIKQETDLTEAQSTLMLRRNQRFENNTSAFRSDPNVQLNRPNMCNSTLQEVNFNNSNFISIKIEPVFDNDNLTGDT